MQRKLVSVIVPIYGTEKYLRRCIDSILNQTYQNLELIAVDDASEDGSLQILESYAGIDERIKIVRHDKNKGLFITRVDGVHASCGEYLMFVDSDDYISVDFIRLLVEAAEKNMLDFVVARTVLESNNGEKNILALHDIELSNFAVAGVDIRRHFWEQAGACYSWHTVWNKLYSKQLWEKALVYVEKLDKHVIMTEDIAFSSVLLFFAQKVGSAENAIYYYCENEGSATDNKKISYETYKKKLTDIGNVFDFVQSFLEDAGAPIDICIQAKKFRQLYGRDWERGINQVYDNPEKAKELIEKFCDDRGVGSHKDDRYFNSIRTPYKDDLETIKKRILYSKCEYISFDIFDTAVVRPFAEPTDLFELLSEEYEKTGAGFSSIGDIRKNSEMAVRQERYTPGEVVKDIHIDDIYDYMHKCYGLSFELCEKIKNKEKKLEIEFCQARKTTYELYEFAVSIGKKVIFTSDMYLDQHTIERILKKNGYKKYTKLFLSSSVGFLKGTGELFQYVLDNLVGTASNVIHIGDNYSVDIEAAKAKGIETIYLPKAMDVFCNKIESLPTNGCYFNNDDVAALLNSRGLEKKTRAYRSMIAMCANRYFDNPYRYFHLKSDYNVDPAFVGYYSLGMCLVGICEWLYQTAVDNNNRIVFTARDGYLIKEAFDIYVKFKPKKIKSKYLYVSRKALLPLMLQNTEDFYNLPIVFQQYTPGMILDLLKFCTHERKNQSNDYTQNVISDDFDKKFLTISEYHKFIQLYMREFYDREKHIKARGIIKKYLSCLKDGDLIFDMGYSGSIHRAINLANGDKKDLTAVFVHSDAHKNYMHQRRGNFKVLNLLDSYPAISGLLREHFFSDLGGSCIGYADCGGVIEPQIEDSVKTYADKFPIEVMQKNALEFVVDYCKTFKNVFEVMDCKYTEAVLPFEAFLGISRNLDRKMFAASYFEDKVYGGKDDINVEQLWMQTILKNNNFKQGDGKFTIKDVVLRGQTDKRKLAFWGTGKICRSILDTYGAQTIDLFLDNNKERSGTLFSDVEIKHPTEIEDWKNIFVVIACAATAEISEQLKNMGLVEYEDYVAYYEVL